MIRILFVLIVLLGVGSPTLAQSGNSATIEHLTQWLELPADQRNGLAEQSFATEPLSRVEAGTAAKMIWTDYETRMRRERESEWKNKLIEIDDLEMKFDFRIFGEKPKGGRSLFISMHGGGGTAAQVNDRQWRNQIGLYKPDEGVYLAPRAPTNTWNLWHQSHIDRFFERIIQNAILFEDVNPNRVYLMGYSAGGDGVYQLAPRMADYLAAAAMMAGHPNDASPLGLRNIGFALYMGGKDGAYNRNKKAEEWKKILADLQKKDPGGYQHDVVIYPQYGHWMNREDAAAVPWMKKFVRNVRPGKIVWRQSSTTHDQFYWIGVNPTDRHNGQEFVVVRDGQTITVESNSGPATKILILLNDQLVDLDQPVVVKIGERVAFQTKVQRTVQTIHESVHCRGDPDKIFSVKIEIDLQK